MIKAIITDLDGTLFHNHGKTAFDLTKRNEESLERLKKNKVNLFIATGRAPVFAHAILDKYGFSDHKIAAFNGSVMEDNDKRINTYLLNKESIKEIYGFLLSDLDGIDCIQLMSVEALRIFHDKTSKHVEPYRKAIEDLHLGSISDIEIKDYISSDIELEIPKVMINFRDPEITKVFFKKLLDEFKDKYFVAQSFDQYIEICSLGTSKGKLVKYLVNEYGYKYDEISVIGDSSNDLGMYVEDVHKFSMQSGSSEELKEKADYIVTDFAECVDISLSL